MLGGEVPRRLSAPLRELLASDGSIQGVDWTWGLDAVGGSLVGAVFCAKAKPRLVGLAAVDLAANAWGHVICRGTCTHDRKPLAR